MLVKVAIIPLKRASCDLNTSVKLSGSPDTRERAYNNSSFHLKYKLSDSICSVYSATNLFNYFCHEFGIDIGSKVDDVEDVL